MDDLPLAECNRDSRKIAKLASNPRLGGSRDGTGDGSNTTAVQTNRGKSRGKNWGKTQEPGQREGILTDGFGQT